MDESQTQLPPAEPEVLELSEFLQFMAGESDRAVALIAASMLDDKIRELLRTFLIDGDASRHLLQPMGPLGSFASKVDMAFALGLIEGQEREEINVIRKIRNRFGHSWRPMEFSDSNLRGLVALLPWKGPESIAEKTLRPRFDFAVVALLVDLLWRNRLVFKERRHERVWPNK